MFDLTKLNLMDISTIGKMIRRIGADGGSLELIAEKITDLLYNRFVNGDAQIKDLALARFFKTQSFKSLRKSRRIFAKKMIGEKEQDLENLKCLTLISTKGERSDWNSCAKSKGHRVIPLTSKESVERIPMILSLINHFGLEVSEVIKPGPQFVLGDRDNFYEVFYVPKALGSPLIPAQENFVIPYNIMSVLGFGGLLPSGDLFAMILFSKVYISQEVAQLFRLLAIHVKICLSPYDRVAFNAQKNSLRESSAVRKVGGENLAVKYTSQAYEKLLQVYEKQVLETTNAIVLEKQLVQTILRNVADGIITIDARGTIKTFNMAAEKIFGYLEGEVTGKNVKLLLPNPYHDEPDAYLQNYRLGRKAGIIGVGREGVGVRKDGSQFSLDLAVSEMDISGQLQYIAVVRDITERKQIENDMRKSLLEKELLMREINHRAKNNMQIISTLIKMQARRSNDERFIKLSHDLDNRLHAMSLVHTQLLQSKDLSLINTGDYFDTLVKNIQSSYGNSYDMIKFNTDTSDISLDMETCMHCGLIINEIVSNSFKYAFNAGQEGRVDILLSYENGSYELIIRDSGAGISKDIDIHNVKSLGMRLVTTLVQIQLSGKIELKRDHGTEFKIIFPAGKGGDSHEKK